ncbi:MAG: hypothetical protein AB7E95_07770 [Kiritimatiellales bacterium]
MTRIERWWWGNILLLGKIFPQCKIEYDHEDFTWVYLDDFPLPENVQQDTTRLLLVLPGSRNPISVRPNAYYLDKNLRGVSGRPLEHIFNDTAYHGCANLSRQGYAWCCLILRRWKPTWDIASGDNLATITNTIFQQLKEL